MLFHNIILSIIEKGNRYIDFVIIISHANSKTLLPIELDGKTKFDTYDSFNDTLERQNDLITQFGFLLRYTNKKMLEQPEEIIREITQFIQHTLDRKDTAEIKRRNFEQYKVNMESKLSNITKQLELLNQQDYTQLQEQFDKLHKQFDILINNKSAKSYIEYKTLVLLSVFCLSFLVLFWYVNKSDQVLYKDVENAMQLEHKQNKERVDLSLVQVEANKRIVHEAYIPSYLARNHIGTHQTVCGVVSEIKPFLKGVYLNIGGNYPNQELSIVVWERDVKSIGEDYFKSLADKIYCIEGHIESFKDKPQIQLKFLEDFYPFEASR